MTPEAVTIPLTMHLDADERSINAAITLYQRNMRWPDAQGGTLIPEGDSDLRGAILAEICRCYLDSREEPSQ